MSSLPSDQTPDPSSGVLTILSGDLVRSTRHDEDAMTQAIEGLQEAATLIASWCAAPVHFTRNRGDGWQIVLPPLASGHPRPGLREALTMRAGLRKQGKRFDTRIAVASGAADLPESGDLNLASGAGFVASGQLLDRLSGASFDHAAGGALAAALVLAGQISQGWTPAQARAILPMLAPAPPIQSVVAEATGISRQAVQQALNGAGYSALMRAITACEDAA